MQLRLNVRHWPGEGRPFVLLHGLASNSLTWAVVGGTSRQQVTPSYRLTRRGHGRSDKPTGGYDFDTIADDLARLLDVLALERPIVAGQSWGGNVVLDFGARTTGNGPKASVLVDGGYIDLQSRPDATWEQVAVQLRPPDLIGTPRVQLQTRIQHAHPDWTEDGVDAMLDNFETMADGTVRPWLTLDRHMRIVRAMWEQHPRNLYPQVVIPVLIAVAEDPANPMWMAVKHQQVDVGVARTPPGSRPLVCRHGA